MHWPRDHGGVGAAHPLHRHREEHREPREDQDRLDGETSARRLIPSVVSSLHPRLPLRCGLLDADLASSMTTS